jgi:hypothetical protein
VYFVTCEAEHSFNGNQPLVLFLTDQSFPPSLSTDEQRCCVVIRLEDCLLSELPGLLKEFFGNSTGYLPEGSVLYFGSLSHLAMRGIETYAEEVVKLYKVFTNMLAGGCSVAHAVVVPLGGIQSEGLVRDLYDLDSWLRSGIVGNMLSLSVTREKLWKIIGRECRRWADNATGERSLFMPENYTNSHKIRTISRAVGEPMPAEIEPLLAGGERELIECLMTEIVDRHAIAVNTEPHLDRCSGDHVFSDDIDTSKNPRLFAIGASHVTRIIGGLAECGLDIVNLAKPGWLLNETSAAEIKKKLLNLNFGSNDILLIDPLSNNTFCGTDSQGNLIDPQKIDNGWHILGELSFRPKPYLKNVLGQLKKITDSWPDNKLILMVPIPRYVHQKCCNQRDHITNFGDPDFQEVPAEIEKVSDLLTAWLQ